MNIEELVELEPGTVEETWYSTVPQTVYVTCFIPTPPSPSNSYYFPPRYFPPRYFSHGYFGRI